MRQRGCSTLAAVLAALAASGAAGQPVCLEQHITADSVFSFGGFGFAVAISGDTAVVGRPTLAAAGSAFVFEYTESTGWLQVQELIAPDVGLGDNWGEAVAIEGDLIAVGSRLHEHDGALGVGAVNVWRRIDGRWVFEQEILPPPDDFNFGRAVEIDQGRVVVTSTGVDAAYIYEFDGTGWALQQSLIAPQENFGFAISLDGDVLAVGAYRDPTLCTNPKVFPSSGLVFVYRFNGEEWIEEQALAPAIINCTSQFGRSVSISGDTLIATSRGPPTAHVFEYDEAAKRWIETAELTAPPGEASNSFGFDPRSAAIQGDIAIIGDDASDNRAYVFQRSRAGDWNLRDVVVPFDPTSSFGSAVWIDQGRAIIGAHLESGGPTPGGAAYIFDLDPPLGDLDCDGLVNTADLAMLLGAWGSCAPALPGDACPGDLNHSGGINAADLALLLGAWTL